MRGAVEVSCRPVGAAACNRAIRPQAARAILAALDADEPPLRLVLGGDAIDTIRARLDQVAGELGR